MNNVNLDENKLFPSTSDRSDRNSEAVFHDNVIARVTICLTAHHKCTGWYIDFSSSFSIICDCMCHTKVLLQKQDYWKTEG
jgi:hypothetical protein